MTLLPERLRQWQDEGGPAEWQAAWERALELLGPLWPNTDMTWDGVVLADGGAALATALYIVTREQNIAPSDVHRAQVSELVARAGGETDAAVSSQWETRLRALGHDLEDPVDPVAVRWRQLRTDNSPPDDAPDAVWIDDHSAHRWGPGFIEGLRRVLAPMYKDRLQF